MGQALSISSATPSSARATQNMSPRRPNSNSQSTIDPSNLPNVAGSALGSLDQIGNIITSSQQYQPAPQMSTVTPSGSRVLRATPARAHRRNTYILYPIFSGASTSRSAERPLSRLHRLHDALRAQRNRNGNDGLVVDARRNASRNSLHS